MEKKMNISLIGYMGSGKSTVGRHLSAQTTFEFIDLDSSIEKYSKKSIPDLFKDLGEIRFRKLEREVLASVLTSEMPFILAVGGGTPVYYDNISLINENTTSVYLRSNPKFLTERLIHEKSARPLIAHLNDEDLPEFVAKHLFERRNFYEQSDFTVDINSKSTDEITREIIHLLNLHPL